MVDREKHRKFCERVERMVEVILGDLPKDAPQELKRDLHDLAEQAADYATKDAPVPLSTEKLLEALR